MNMRDGIMNADQVADKINASRPHPHLRSACDSPVNDDIGRTPQPAADNAHVEKGCEQFAEEPPHGAGPVATTAGKEPWPPSRMEQLYNEGQSYQEQANRKMRAAQLLAKHPEFEDFLEFLRLVPIY